jgi:hypothetical protein
MTAVNPRVEERFDRLSAGVRGLRGRRRNLPADRALLVAGYVALPLGLAFIILGWWGAAHTPRLFEQVPYLISGGLLGVALVAAGGFFYFAYWLTRVVYEGRTQTDRITDLLARMDERLAALELAGGAAGAAGVPSAGEASAGEASAGGGAPHRAAGNGSAPAASRPRAGARAGRSTATATAMPFVATAAGTMYHTEDCAVVAGKDGLRSVSAQTEGLTACRICQPRLAG